MGFPAEDEDAFGRTLELVGRLGISKVHVFPYSPRPGTRTAAADTVPPAVKQERSARLRALSDELCRRRWQAKLGTTDRVLVDRPGRGYADDYTPWLVDAPIGEFVRARASASRRRGCSPSPPDNSLPLLPSRRRRRPRPRCRRLRRDPRHQRRLRQTHLLVLPERHVDTFRDIGAFSDDEAKRMLAFVAETARTAGLEDYRVLVNVGPGAGQTVFHLHWHVLGGRVDPDLRPPHSPPRPRMTLIARIEAELKAARPHARTSGGTHSPHPQLAARGREGAAAPAVRRGVAAGSPARAQARLEAAEAFRAGGREERAAAEEQELEVIEEFMPDQLAEEEIEEIIDDVISEVGATSIRDMGRVMAGVMHQVSGRADGSAVSQLVKEKLA